MDDCKEQCRTKYYMNVASGDKLAALHRVRCNGECQTKYGGTHSGLSKGFQVDVPTNVTGEVPVLHATGKPPKEKQPRPVQSGISRSGVVSSCSCSTCDKGDDSDDSDDDVKPEVVQRTGAPLFSALGRYHGQSR